jgi:hypothetical protein
VGGPLLDLLSVEYNKHDFERLVEYKCDYGLAGASDGATVYHTSLVIFCHRLLHRRAPGSGGLHGLHGCRCGTKEGTSIANEMCTQCAKSENTPFSW